MPRTSSRKTATTQKAERPNVVSVLLAILLFVALIVLAERVFFDIRRAVFVDAELPTIGQLYEEKGGEIIVPVDGAGGANVVTAPVPGTMMREVIVVDKDICETVTLSDLHNEFQFYNVMGTPEDSRLIEESYLASCVDTDILVAAVTEYQQLRGQTEFSVTLWQLLLVVPFIVFGLLLFFLLDRKTRTFRIIGYPFAAAALWVGLHYLFQLGLAFYRLFPRVGLYIVLVAAVIILTALIWGVQRYFAHRPTAPAPAKRKRATRKR